MKAYLDRIFNYGTRGRFTGRKLIYMINLVAGIGIFFSGYVRILLLYMVIDLNGNM